MASADSVPADRPRSHQGEVVQEPQAIGDDSQQQHHQQQQQHHHHQSQPNVTINFAEATPVTEHSDTLLSLPSPIRTNSILSARRRRRTGSGYPSTYDSSSSSSSDSELDDDPTPYFVQNLLPTHSYHHEHLRDHIAKYEWDQFGRQILATIVSDRKPNKESQPAPGLASDRSHYSHFQVFDIGTDGAPLPVEFSGDDKAQSKASTIWHTIKDINSDSARRQAVGRITIAREPSPVLFAAVHLTMQKYFDVDELFKYLVQSDASSAMCRRAYEEDRRRQRTFVFNLEYYTIIGEECKPMSWQLSDKQPGTLKSNVSLTRCSSIVALHLQGNPIRKVRNPARKTTATTRHGYVYDPWAAWQVLNIQCYPDWKATTDLHDSSKHYLNGPEAFLHSLLQEFKDAQVRFEDIHRRISKLVTPPPDFIFNEELRDKCLFEDQGFTFTRRYFWAHETLGIMNDSIKAMIDAFEDTFTDDVWEGKDKILWPLPEDSPRNEFFKRRLKNLRGAFEREMKGLRTLIAENNDRKAQIRGLRDHLFSGTSVVESRKSVELAEITTQQGHNVKLLTLVNIFFLPLTFVTSVFGMTNMETEPRFWPFGITLALVCFPFFVMIAQQWMDATSFGHKVRRWCLAPFRLLIGRPTKEKGDDSSSEEDDEEERKERVRRTLSAQKGMAMRLDTASRQASRQPSQQDISSK